MRRRSQTVSSTCTHSIKSCNNNENNKEISYLYTVHLFSIFYLLLFAAFVVYSLAIATYLLLGAQVFNICLV